MDNTDIYGNPPGSQTGYGYAYNVVTGKFEMGVTIGTKCGPNKSDIIIR